MEILEHYDTFIAVVLGSVLGSFKASLDSKDEQTKWESITNFLLGFYCGIAIAYAYKDSLEIGFLGLMSLVSAMIGTNVLEVISDLSPSIVKKYLKGKFK